jgi:hypothetical protein
MYVNNNLATRIVLSEVWLVEYLTTRSAAL